MPAFSSIIGIVSAIGSVLGGLGSMGLFGGGGGGGGGQQMLPAPQVSAPEAVTQGPPEDVTGFARRPVGGAPAFLQLASGMTPLQQRSAITTGGVSGESGIYRDPAALEYYRNLVTSELTDPSGTALGSGQVLPIERQFAESVLGENIRQETPGSFLSAIWRGIP